MASDDNAWVVVVADDDEMVHLVTELVLKDLTFEGRPVRLVNTSSARETQSFLNDNGSVAVLLLDVVMETPSAGLDLVTIIRSELDDRRTRIIIRTGQAGYEDAATVIERYDINGYTRKEQLKHQDLRDAVILGLRGYRDIVDAERRSA